MDTPHASRRRLSLLCLIAALASAALLSSRASTQVKGSGFDQEVSRALRDYDRLSLDPAGAELSVRQTGRLTLETSAGTFALALTPNDVRAENYRAVEVLENGETREMPREPSHTFKGSVEGEGGSVARFTLDGRKVEGLIIKGGEKFFVEPAARYTREAAPGDLLFYREADVIADPVSCAVETLSSKVNEQISRTQSVGINESQPAVPVSPIREAQLATEADFEYVAAAGGTAAANSEILSIVNQINGIYQPQIGLTFNVVFQRAWDTPNDPFNASTLDGLTTELRNLWTDSPPVPVEGRDLVHLWTGRDLEGARTGFGIDNVTINNVNQRGVVCVVVPANPTTGRPAQTFAFGVSERQTNEFLRVIVPAHEIGHNFSASHPTDCAGTIMSPEVEGGGTTALSFCQFSRDEITNYINSHNSCLAVATNVTPVVQFSQADYRVVEGTPGVLVTVTRSSGDGTSFVQYQTVDGSASERLDYTTAVGTLRFNPGETSKSFEILITNDTYVEQDETFRVSLVNPSNAALGTPSAANVTITSNDSTDGPNPVGPQSFNADFFVRQHYADFLNREPDASGLNFWVGQTSGCGNPDLQVCRINVSAAFFLSIEFQETGFYAIRVQRVAFGRRSDDPQTRLTYREVIASQRTIGEGVVVDPTGSFRPILEANKNAYAAAVVADPNFAARFQQATTAAAFVDALYVSAGVAPAGTERQDAINAYNNPGSVGAANSRAAALRVVADSNSVRNAELRTAFVLLEYHGYLRRDPDQTGYNFWLTKLNQFNGNFVEAEMVNSFITSIEYLQRFGP